MVLPGFSRWLPSTRKIFDGSCGTLACGRNCAQPRYKFNGRVLDGANAKWASQFGARRCLVSVWLEQCTATATLAQSRIPVLTNACSTLNQHAARLQMVRAHSNASIYITHTTSTWASAAGASSPLPLYNPQPAPRVSHATGNAPPSATTRARSAQHETCFLQLRLRACQQSSARPTACCPMCTAHTSVSLNLMLHALPSNSIANRNNNSTRNKLCMAAAATALSTAQLLLPPRPPCAHAWK